MIIIYVKTILTSKREIKISNRYIWIHTYDSAFNRRVPVLIQFAGKAQALGQTIPRVSNIVTNVFLASLKNFIQTGNKLLQVKL